MVSQNNHHLDGKPIILVVDDHEDIRRNIIRTLENENYSFIEAANYNEVEEILSSTVIDIITLDLHLPDAQNRFLSITGLALLEIITNNYRNMPVIVFSAMSPAHRRDALRLGAFDCIEKAGSSESMNQLRNRIREALYERNAKRIEQTNEPDFTNVTPAIRRKIVRIIKDSFDLNEFKDLCMEANITYDHLKGEGFEAKIRNLVEYMYRRQQLPTLIKTCQELRPLGSWPII